MQSRRVSTAEILAARALEHPCGQECVDWAVTMLIEGRDAPHLRMLAGQERPYNHFELANLRDRALDELGEGRGFRDQAVRLYARERLQAAIAGHADLPTEVAVVAQLCIENDYARDLFDFYLLHKRTTISRRQTCSATGHINKWPSCSPE
jgi:hypothetical protein